MKDDLLLSVGRLENPGCSLPCIPRFARFLLEPMNVGIEQSAEDLYESVVPVRGIRIVFVVYVAKEKSRKVKECSADFPIHATSKQLT